MSATLNSHSLAGISKPPAPDLGEVQKILPFWVPGTYEARCLTQRKGRTISGLYHTDNFSAFTQRLQPWAQNPEVTGCYMTINPVKDDLVARANHRFEDWAKQTTNDLQIVKRTTLLLDIDSIREPGICATPEERRCVEDLTTAIRQFLRDQSWPEPVVIDSGNGRYLLYRVDLPNDEGSRELIKNALQALAKQFDTDKAVLDTSPFNASRIARLPGTINRKGDHCPSIGREHRRALVLETPEIFQPVPQEALEGIAAQAKPTKTTKRRRASTASTKPRASSTDRQSSAAEVLNNLQDADPSEEVLRRARGYLQKCDSAIEGEGGSRTAMWVARVLCWGFDLSPAQARPLFEEYNQRCQPPWSPGEIEHKLQDAATKPFSRPRGWLLERSRRQSESRKRPTVILTPDVSAVLDQVIPELVEHPSVYTRSGKLVELLPASEGGCGTPDENSTLPAGPTLAGPTLAGPTLAGPTLGDRVPSIREIPEARLFVLISESVRLCKVNGSEENLELQPVTPPTWLVKAVAAAGHWPWARRLVAVVDAPTLRPDGSVVQKPGYDPQAAIFLHPQGQFPQIPEQPSRQDAQQAAATLAEVFCDFPLASREHLAGVIAAILTPLARFAFRGPTPLFLIDANVRAAGKGKLATAITLIATGRQPAIAAYSSDDAETRKSITGIAAAGERVVLFDNIAGSFGGPALDAALTGCEWQDRILGTNSRPKFPLLCTWLATGNNVVLMADTSRRVCHIRLESPEENPENRSDFRHPDLEASIRRNRGELLVAALTILVGYIRNGRPDQNLPAWGSFEGWSSLVRSAVVWAGLPDPAATRKDLAEQSDATASQLGLLLDAWENIDPKGEGLCAADALRRASQDPDNDFELFRLNLIEVFGTLGGKLPSAKSLGMKLSHLRRRVRAGRYFECVKPRDRKIWHVAQVADDGTCGTNFASCGTNFPSSATPLEPTETGVSWTPVVPVVPKPALAENASASSTSEQVPSKNSHPTSGECETREHWVLTKQGLRRVDFEGAEIGTTGTTGTTVPSH